MTLVFFFRPVRPLSLNQHPRSFIKTYVRVQPNGQRSEAPVVKFEDRYAMSEE